MKLEFLNDIWGSGKSPDGTTDQLVRLYDFDKQEAEKFRSLIQQNLIENKQPLQLDKVHIIEPVNCNLTLQISSNNKGISTNDKQIFFCDLTLEGYAQMIFLLRPFCEKQTNGFQWLYDIDTPIEFLFSPSGNW